MRIPSWLSIALATACSNPPPPESPAQQMPFGVHSSAGAPSSGSSPSDFDGYKGKGVSIPLRARSTDQARLSVRPDLWTVSFALRDARSTPQAALEAARGTAQSISADLLETLGAAASIELKGYALTMSVHENKPTEMIASVDGVLAIALASDQDFWARSRLFTKVLEASARISLQAQQERDPLHAVSFDAPKIEVANPEAHRPELIRRWVERARQFSSAAETEGAPLVIRDCAPPVAITQSPLSFDEVSLTLEIGCHLDTQKR